VRGSLAALWVSQPASLPCTCMHASATAHGLTGACQLRGPEPVTGLWMLCHVRHAPVALGLCLFRGTCEPGAPRGCLDSLDKSEQLLLSHESA